MNFFSVVYWARFTGSLVFYLTFVVITKKLNGDWIEDVGARWRLECEYRSNKLPGVSCLYAFIQTAQQGFLTNMFIHMQNSATGAFIHQKIYSVNIRWVCRSQNLWTDQGGDKVTDTLLTHCYPVDSDKIYINLSFSTALEIYKQNNICQADDLFSWQNNFK